MNKLNRPGVGVAVIIKKENKVLFGKRLKKSGYETWHFPGGHLENGESFVETAKREVKEETNVDVDNLKFVTVTNDIHNDGLHMITIFMEGNYVGGEVKDMEPDKAEGWDWYEWDKLPQPWFLPIENFIKQKINPFE